MKIYKLLFPNIVSLCSILEILFIIFVFTVFFLDIIPNFIFYIYKLLASSYYIFLSACFVFLLCTIFEIFNYKKTQKFFININLKNTKIYRIIFYSGFYFALYNLIAFAIFYSISFI